MGLLVLDGDTPAEPSLDGAVTSESSTTTDAPIATSTTGGGAAKAGAATIGVSRRPLFAPTGEGPDPTALKQLRAEAEHLLGQQESLDDWKWGLSQLEKNVAMVQAHLAELQARRNKLPPEQEVVELEKARVELEKKIAAHRAQAESSRHAIEAEENRARNLPEGRLTEAQRVIDAVEAFNVAQEAVTKAHEEVEKTTAVFDNLKKHGVSVIHGDPQAAIALAEHDIVIARSRLDLAEAERERPSMACDSSTAEMRRPWTCDCPVGRTEATSRHRMLSLFDENHL